MKDCITVFFRLQVEDSSSYRNTHEGDFVIALCRYLVLQGYSPSRITVLATYSGQMFYLRNVSADHVF
jgi:superfamily I DNA and/or RNA helicase